MPEASNILDPNNSTAPTRFILSSVPERPNSDGFYYRIIAAPTTQSAVTVATVKELHFSTVTLELTSTIAPVATGGNPPTLPSSAPFSLNKGEYVEFRAGFGLSNFTVVEIECQLDACEVRRIRTVSNALNLSTYP